MRRHRPAVTALLVLALLALVPAARAQSSQPPPSPPGTRPGVAVPPRPPSQPATAPAARAPRLPMNRGIVFVGAAFQPGSSSFTDRRTSSVSRETASTTTNYDVAEGVGVDAGVFLRVRGGLGAGLAVSSQVREGDGQLTVSSPHPFFFDRARTATVDVDGQDRTEVGTHLSLAWIAPSSRRLRFVVFAGPSLFSVTQTLVDTPSIADTYPYDAITVSAGSSSDVSETMVGVHGGVDAAWYFTRRFGAGVLARFATGSKSISVNGGDTFDLEAGGAQIAVGLRIAF